MFVTIPGEFHSYDEVGEGMDILVEFEDFNLSTWIAPRLLKLGEDVAEGGLTPRPLLQRGSFIFAFTR